MDEDTRLLPFWRYFSRRYGTWKTLQSIAYIDSVLPEIREKKLPILVVSPSSLVYNWFSELKKFAPHIRAVIADGNQTERRKILKDVAEFDVVITSYPLLRRDIRSYARPFHTLFLDEAQAFKIRQRKLQEQ